MGRQTYLFKRAGTYYFRMVIPADLRPRFGKNELVSSLHTNAYALASAHCALLAGDFNRLFTLARIQPMLSLEQLKQISRTIFATHLSSHQAAMNIPHSPTQVLTSLLMNKYASFNISPSTPIQPDFSEVEQTTLLIAAKQEGIEEGSTEYAHLKKAVSRALTEWKHYLQEFSAGQLEITARDSWFSDLYPDYTPPQMVNTPRDVTLTSELLSVITTRHLAEDTADKKSKQKKQVAANWFVEWFGDKQIHLITKEDARNYKTNLARMPKNATQRYPNISTSQLIQRKFKQTDLISTSSLNAYLVAMSTLFNWAKKNYDNVVNNPFEGIAVKGPKNDKEKRRAFTSEQIKKIFENPLFSGCRSETQRYIPGEIVIRDAKYWVPILGLYTGARLNEICQLYIEDVYKHGEIWVLDINQNGNDKRLKTVAARRKIPLHPQLLALGFHNYVTTQGGTPKDRVFPEIALGADDTYSHTYSKQFAYALRNKFEITDEKVTFHSFRHSLTDELRNADVDTADIKRILGHEDSSVTANYGSSETLERLHRAISKVHFPIQWHESLDSRPRVVARARD